MGRYTEEMRRAGVLIDAGGLQPTSKGARVRYSGNRTQVVDGPFTESKELVGGYSIIEAKSLDEAVAWAMKMPNPGGAEGEVEIRPLHNLDDSGRAQPSTGTSAARATAPSRDPREPQASEEKRVKFMIIVKATPESEAGIMPGPAIFEAMAKFNEEMIDAGVMVAGEGLQQSSKGARVRYSQGRYTTVDGPFARPRS